MAADLLLHVCCAPCLTASYDALREEGFSIRGYFYNPNIQPYREYRRRRDTLNDYAGRKGINVEIVPDYRPEEHLVPVLKDLKNRCEACYRLRLQATAEKANQLEISAYSTTLLISPYQDQKLIKEIGEDIAQKEGLMFIYRDLRPVFQRSLELSAAENLYMQPYCGCLFSERERFYSKARKQLRKERQYPHE